MNESPVSEDDFKKEEKNSLQQSLISILITEHKNRRDMIFSTLMNLKEKIDTSEDEMDISMGIDHLNEVMKSSIKNDENIVDLVELLLKYEYDEEQVKELKEYKNELSENELDINLDE